jgi:hypothetical protein
VPLDFFCRCTKPTLLASLRRVGGDALRDDLLREHDETRAAALEADAGEARFDGLRTADVVTTLTCGACNRRHYVARADLS